MGWSVFLSQPLFVDFGLFAKHYDRGLKVIPRVILPPTHGVTSVPSLPEFLWLPVLPRELGWGSVLVIDLKLDPGKLTLDAPPSPWEARRPRGVKISPCLSADLLCLALSRARLSACPSVRPSLECTSSYVFFSCFIRYITCRHPG